MERESLEILNNIHLLIVFHRDSLFSPEKFEYKCLTQLLGEAIALVLAFLIVIRYMVLKNVLFIPMQFIFNLEGIFTLENLSKEDRVIVRNL